MWISLKQLASAAEITYRAAVKAVDEARRNSKPWRGAILEVRTRAGRGGSRGAGYEVRLASLPDALQRRFVTICSGETATGATTSGGADPTTQVAEAAIWPREEREARHAAFGRLPGSMQAEAKRRLLAVQHFQASEGIDMPMLERYAATAAYAGESASTIRRWVGACKDVHPGDWLVVLAPKHLGNRISAPISGDALEFIKAEYFQLTKPALRPIYRRAQRLATERNWVLPSYASVKRKVKAEPRWFHVLRREGSEQFERLFPTQERDYSTLKLMEVWCGDGRKADLFARFEDGSVGRPIVLAFLELRSRVCVGYAIGKVENVEVVRRAWLASARSTRAIPERVLLDNGRAFTSKQVSGGVPNRFRYAVRKDEPLGFMTLCGVKITWAQPGLGRSKPIESFWRHAAQMERQFAGAYVGNRPDARPEDCDPGKAIPIAQYRRAFDEMLVIYHATPHRGDAMHGRSPRQVYDELLPNAVITQPTEEQLLICLQAADKIRLDPSDLSFRLMGNSYWSEQLAALPPGAKVDVRYNPDDAAEAAYVYHDGRFFCRAPLRYRTGFQDMDAAKGHQRANRKFRKSLREQAAAMKDMTAANRWKARLEAPPSPETAAALVLPAPKVGRLIQLPKALRQSSAEGMEANPEAAEVTAEQVSAAITNHFARKARGQ